MNSQSSAIKQWATWLRFVARSIQNLCVANNTVCLRSFLHFYIATIYKKKVDKTSWTYSNAVPCSFWYLRLAVTSWCHSRSDATANLKYPDKYSHIYTINSKYYECGTDLPLDGQSSSKRLKSIETNPFLEYNFLMWTRVKWEPVMILNQVWQITSFNSKS